MVRVDDVLAWDYLAECRERLITVEADLLTLERGDAESNEEVVHRIFRSMHWVQGGATIFDLVTIGELARQMENVLLLIQSRQLSPTADRVRILLAGIDQLRELIRNAAGSNQADIGGIMAALTGMSAHVAHQGTGHARPDGRHLRVLLVEDDFASRILLQTFLSSYAECHIAVNGREAVEAFRSALEHGQRYDLICMDVMMPEMDGREAVRQVRALEEEHGILSSSGVKIIMTTAVDDVKEVIRCFHELCDSYLTKPVDRAALLGQMKTYHLIQ